MLILWLPTEIFREHLTDQCQNNTLYPLLNFSTRTVHEGKHVEEVIRNVMPPASG
jgi:hypothetical protein